MGEVIGKRAAVADILADIETTLRNATARGGVWHTDAERMLRAAANLAQEVTVELKSTTHTVAGLQSALSVADDTADALMAGLYDQAYNLVDRPGAGSDPIFELLFPGGSSAYTQAPLAEQPVLMNMLARLFERNIHPRIPPATSAAFAVEIRAASVDLRDAVQALAAPAAEQKMLTTMQAMTARSGQVHLQRLKRMWKAQGFSEADIHDVIPDRPRSRKPSEALTPETEAAPPSDAAADAVEA